MPLKITKYFVIYLELMNCNFLSFDLRSSQTFPRCHIGLWFVFLSRLYLSDFYHILPYIRDLRRIRRHRNTDKSHIIALIGGRHFGYSLSYNSAETDITKLRRVQNVFQYTRPSSSPSILVHHRILWNECIGSQFYCFKLCIIGIKCVIDWWEIMLRIIAHLSSAH